jgi:hypothetical protein
LKEQSADLRPPAVLAVGICGHQKIDLDGPLGRALAVTFDSLLLRFARALTLAARKNCCFFSSAEPILRVISCAAEGADLLGARCARTLGAEIACILPFSFDEYRKDFVSPAASELAESLINAAAASFILMGTREEGARAYERANDIMLGNVDILIAVWDGLRADARAGTGEVVQAAITRAIPVVVIVPENPEQLTLLSCPDQVELEPPIATDLFGKPLDEDLTALVSEILLPPGGSKKRQGLVDLFNERPYQRRIRFEYPLLLQIFRTGKPAVAAADCAQILHGAGGMPVGPANSPAANPGLTEPLLELHRCVSRIDQLASYYALLFRSSITSEFLAIIVAAFLASFAMLTFPNIAGASIVAQLAVNGLVLGDVWFRNRRRWHERWLDYRLLAERSTCLRWLHPLGLGLEQSKAAFGDISGSWVNWYMRRIERGLGAPNGVMGFDAVQGFRRQLVETEIPKQLNYHRATLYQLGILERRLSIAATIALYVTFALAAVFAVWAYFGDGLDRVSWRPFAIVILFVLPAATTAFNGIRADADLVRLVERSALTSAALERLRRAILSKSPTYDRVAIAARRAAALKGEELSEWRFVLESRRARTKRESGPFPPESSLCTNGGNRTSRTSN